MKIYMHSIVALVTAVDPGAALAALVERGG